MKIFAHKVKEGYRFLLICVMLTAVFLWAQSIETENEKGVVTYVDGSAKKQKLQEDNWKTVETNTVVVSGERVRTFTESRAELEMAKLDIIRMAPKTTIDILRLYEESKDQIRESKIVLQSGDLWANIAKKSDKMTFSIGTPVAAAAITGTTLRLNVAPDSSSEVRVYSGEVILSRGTDEKRGGGKASLKPTEIPGPTQIPGPQEVTLEQWSVIVKSMQKVKIDHTGRIVQSGEFSHGDKDEQSEWIRWNILRDKALK